MQFCLKIITDQLYKERVESQASETVIFEGLTTRRRGSLPGEEASCESLESLGEGHKGCMVNQSTSALLLKLSHMLKSENITVSGSLLLQTKLNNDFPKEKG